MSNFFEKICNQEILAQTEECSVIETIDTRRKHCGWLNEIVYRMLYYCLSNVYWPS